MGISAFWRFLSDISATLARIHTRVSTGWARKFEKFRIFHHFESLRPYILEIIKNRRI